jgi:hypothetical protein
LKYPPFPWAQNIQDGAHQTTEIFEKGTIFFGPFQKFLFLVGAILKMLCPRERRVFQSKLGVSSGNQCNLHHSPHTGHLGKKIKKDTIFFGHPVFQF